MFQSIVKSMGSTLQKMIPKNLSMITPLVGAATNVVGKLVGNSLTQSVTKTVNSLTNTIFNQTLNALSNQVSRVKFADIDIKEVSSVLSPEFSGYVPDMTGGVPAEYLITIRNTKNWIIKAVLQDISFTTDSVWNPIVPAGVGHLLNSLSQLMFKSAPLSKWSSRRIWQGTSPISINLELKFRAIYDEWKEVVRPCMRLQQMCLPSMPYGEGNFASDVIPRILPPGPSPFFTNMEEMISWDQGKQIVSDRTGDEIYIQIGRFLKFKSVIVKNVKASYSPQMSAKGFPVSGTVNLTFETFQMMTLEDLEKSYLIEG